jgi:hypothetical protein
MYLRVTAFTSDPAQLDAGVAFLRDAIIPALSKAPGYLGATGVIDREKSQGMASTLWDSLESMNNAEQAGSQARTDSTRSVGLEVVDVDRFEITVMHMADPTVSLPTYTRLITGYGDPGKAQAALSILRDDSLPILQKQPGYRAFVSGVNRMTGRAFTATSFATAAQRDATDSLLADSRTRVVEAGGLYGLQVSLVETVVADIKVPISA